MKRRDLLKSLLVLPFAGGLKSLFAQKTETEDYLAREPDELQYILMSTPAGKPGWLAVKWEQYGTITPTRRFFWNELMGETFEHPTLGKCFAMYNVAEDKIFMYRSSMDKYFPNRIGEVHPVYLKVRMPSIEEQKLWGYVWRDIEGNKGINASWRA